ncbi:MAG: helix-turn-helix domain-containing protein [Pseudomonadota bacterium]
MTALPQALYREVRAALLDAGRMDLADKLVPFRPRRALSSGQAAERLGVSSPNTVKNWLESGIFPGAYRTGGGHWRFPVEEVEAARARLDALAERNRQRDLAPPDVDDGEEQPLL